MATRRRTDDSGYQPREPIASAPPAPVGVDPSKILGYGIIALLIGFGIYGAFVDWGGLVAYLTELAPSVAKLIILVAVVLALNYVIENIRNNPTYDANGAAREVSTAHARIGTKAEKAGDNTTAAIKFAARTALLIALIVTLWTAST